MRWEENEQLVITQFFQLIENNKSLGIVNKSH